VVKAEALGGAIEVWVSNAGVGAVGRFHERPIAAHEQVIRTNLIGHMNDAHAVMPVFIKQRRGVFINTISLGAFTSTPFSEALRAEMADHPGIHICDVYPAFIDTPGISHAANYVGRQLTAPPLVCSPRSVQAVVRLSQRLAALVMEAWLFFGVLGWTAPDGNRVCQNEVVADLTEKGPLNGMEREEKESCSLRERGSSDQSEQRQDRRRRLGIVRSRLVPNRLSHFDLPRLERRGCFAHANSK
jgi:NAD(P)-dependent dehydrogenase (short-subunit alcohol dehydrogenase family)